MAMVTAYKPGTERPIKVSKNSYEHIFKRKGYRLMKPSEKGESGEPGIPGSSNAEKIMQDEPDINTIPVSDMDNDQLKQYAKEHGIDISKTKSAAEARKVIQAAIRNKNM